MIEEGVPDTKPVPLTQGIVYAVYGKKRQQAKAKVNKLIV